MMTGHHHEDNGADAIGDKTYVAQGSLFWTGHRSDKGRRPACSLLEIGSPGVKATIVRPKVPAQEEVMDWAVTEQISDEEEGLDAFLEQLSAAEFGSVDPFTLIGEMDLKEDVRERVREYLKKAEE
jgi:hypothetical protein